MELVGGAYIWISSGAESIILLSLRDDATTSPLRSSSLECAESVGLQLLSLRQTSIESLMKSVILGDALRPAVLSGGPF